MKLTRHPALASAIVPGLGTALMGDEPLALIIAVTVISFAVFTVFYPYIIFLAAASYILNIYDAHRLHIHKKEVQR